MIYSHPYKQLLIIVLLYIFLHMSRYSEILLKKNTINYCLRTASHVKLTINYIQKINPYIQGDPEQV